MRVLLGHNYYRTSAPSGEDIVFRNEKRLLERSCDIVLFERHNDDIDDSTMGNKIAVALDTTWSRDAYRAMVKTIRDTKPDIAHFHNTFPQLSPSVYAACRQEGVPVIQTLHNYRLICANGLLNRGRRPCEACVGASLLSALRYRCYRGSLTATAAIVAMLAYNRYAGSYARNVDRYICLTNFAVDKLAAGGLPRDRIRVKPNFVPEPPTAGEYPRMPYAVYVGRLSEEKGVHTLLNAWQHVGAVQLKVIGDGARRVELERYAAEKCLNVEFLGQRHRLELIDIVKKAQFQVVPSECYEGFGMVVIEAYACGTPLIASKIGSLAEIIDEGVTGLLFRPGDMADLAEKARRMTQSSELCRAMGMAGRRRFEERYTERQNLQMLMDIYTEVLNQSPN